VLDERRIVGDLNDARVRVELTNDRRQRIAHERMVVGTTRTST